MGRSCSDCGILCSRSSFSRNQWLKGDRISRCKDCIAGKESRNQKSSTSRPPPLITTTHEPSLIQSLSLLSVADVPDEAIFQQPPPREVCAICFLRLPGITEQSYHECCGKILCSGCVVADLEASRSPPFPCPFCRTPGATSPAEAMDQLNKRIEAKDSMALHQVGCFYDEGGLGLRQNYKMAMDYWLRAIKIGPASSLGSTRAHCSIAEAYEHGEGVVKDMNKAIYHYSLAAMGGNEQARFNLGAFYCKDGDTKKGMMHFAVAARAGDDDCMKEFQRGYISFSGHVTNDEYADTMRAYKESKDEMRSEQRYIVATRKAMTMGRVH